MNFSKRPTARRMDSNGDLNLKGRSTSERNLCSHLWGMRWEQLQLFCLPEALPKPTLTPLTRLCVNPFVLIKFQ